LETGDIFSREQEDLYQVTVSRADEIAEQRAEFRSGIVSPARADKGEANLHEDEVTTLRRRLREASQLIAKLAERNGLPGVGSREREIRTRPRRTMLAVIAALCKEVGIDPTERGAASEVASITDKHGLRVSEDTIRAMFREMGDALESRESGKPNSGK